MPFLANSATNSSPFSIAITIEPLEISLRGFTPNSLQICLVQSKTGILSAYTSTPKPEQVATSQQAPNIPPSVTSCIAFAPICEAIFPSLTTESKLLNSLASFNVFSLTFFNFSILSLAKIDVPSRPAYFVITKSSPAFAPDEAISLLDFPITVQLKTGLITASVISV